MLTLWITSSILTCFGLGFIIYLLIQPVYKMLTVNEPNVDSFLKEMKKVYLLTYICVTTESGSWSVGERPFKTWKKKIGEIEFEFDKKLSILELQFLSKDIRSLISKELYEKVISESSKMAALGEMAAGIAHEINNPLAIVHGKASICEMLLEEKDVDMNRVKEEIRDVIDTAERMDKIINSLRYFVRDDKRDPMVETSLEEILDNAQVLSVDRCKKQGINLVVEKSGEDTLLCKPTQISQVLINLVSNSVDAIKDQEGIRWIKISTKSKQESVVFEVTDSGLGISKEDGEQILNSFYTTKKFNKTSGLGLGLNIVKRIVESHFGNITIDYSCPNTKFIVEIPKTKVLDNQGEKKDVA